jgi:sugar phosphate isomerase/epimerase
VRPLAVAHLTAIDLSPCELIDAAAGAGFDAVCLRLLPAGRLDPARTDPGPLAETRSRLADHGCGVLDVEVIRLRPSLDLDAIAPAIEAAATVGARHLLAIGEDGEDEQLAEQLHALCLRASPLGLRPMLEFIPFTVVRTIEQAVAIVDAADHPAAGVLVDPLHLRRSGGSPAQVKALADSHPKLFPYAQLCDARLAAPPGGALYEEAVTDRLLPGDGELPLRELLDALPAQAPLSVETPVKALAGLPSAERVARTGQAVRGWLEG